MNYDISYIFLFTKIKFEVQSQSTLNCVQKVERHIFQNGRITNFVEFENSDPEYHKSISFIYYSIPFVKGLHM